MVSGVCNGLTNCATLSVNTPTTASGPSDLVRCPGQAANFSVVASGTGPFTYQWSKAGVDIAGATGEMFSLGSVTAANAGTYCVVATGVCDSVTNCATLAVNSPTTASGPTDLIQCPGPTANFSVTAA